MDSSAWLAIPVILAAALVVLFTRRKRRDTPPTVSHLVPWVGSSMTMAKDPDAFFANATARYGSIFGVTAAGTHRYFITSATLSKQIHKQSKTFVFTPYRIHLSNKAFGMSRSSVYDTPLMDSDFFETVHRILAPSNITITEGLLQSYTKYAALEVSKFQPPEEPIPARKLLYNMLYRASGYAFFGPTFDAEASVDDFVRFDKMFPLLILDLKWPFTIPGLSARAAAQAHMLKYLHSPHQAGEYISYLETHGRQTGLDDEDIAAMFLTTLWALEANAPLAAYWAVVLSLIHPDGLAPLIAEIDSARSEWEQENPSLSFAANCDQFVTKTKLPLLNSVIQETLRYCTSSFSIRRVIEPTTFAGYNFLPGEELVVAGRVGHLDSDFYDDAESFVPTRFVANGKESGKNSTANMAPFGGGVSICEGRHFAQSELKIFICSLLSELQIELAPGAKKEDVVFDRTRIGLGVIHPTGDVMLSVRRRVRS